MNHEQIFEFEERSVLGLPLFDFAEVGSTNDVAKEWALRGAEAPRPPFVVRAARQTRGRGRGANAWWSDSGGLTLTAVLEPRRLGLPDKKAPLISLAAAVAVVEAVRPWLERGAIGIRWPNDVEIDDHKIAGILPEQINRPEGPCLLIGIGLNVDSRFKGAPEEVRALAASLADFRDPPLSVREAEQLFELQRLAADDPRLPERWRAWDRLRDRPVRIDLEGRLLEGVARGIAADGALIVETADGSRPIHGGRVLRQTAQGVQRPATSQ